MVRLEPRHTTSVGGAQPGCRDSGWGVSPCRIATLGGLGNNGQYEADLCASPPQVAAVWSDSTTAGALSLSRIVDGGRLDAPPLSPSTGTNNDSPRIAADDGGMRVLWTNSSNIYGARFALDGTQLDPGGAAWTTSGGEGEPAVACGAGTCAGVWTDNNSFLRRLESALVPWSSAAPTAAPVQTIPWDTASTGEVLPVVSCLPDGTLCWVVWLDALEEPSGRAGVSLD